MMHVEKLNYWTVSVHLAQAARMTNHSRRIAFAPLTFLKEKGMPKITGKAVIIPDQILLSRKKTLLWVTKPFAHNVIIPTPHPHLPTALLSEKEQGQFYILLALRPYGSMWLCILLVSFPQHPCEIIRTWNPCPLLANKETKTQSSANQGHIMTCPDKNPLFPWPVSITGTTRLPDDHDNYSWLKQPLESSPHHVVFLLLLHFRELTLILAWYVWKFDVQ